MLPRLLAAARGPFAAFVIVASAFVGPVPAAFADDAKPADKPAGQEQAKEPQKAADEYAEAQKEISGPAGNPECVWLGRRVVGLLHKDDLDTAFRHLDLYDRFGCPSAHIQAAFRCIILHGDITDPKVEKIEERVRACWISPTNPAPPAAASAAPAAAAAPAANAPAKN
jgi:hypothetical protein